jgi:hypothetical protein
MSQHKDEIRLRHMIDHAMEAILRKLGGRREGEKSKGTK